MFCNYLKGCVDNVALNVLGGVLPNIMLQDSINIAKVLKWEIDIILLSILLIYACHDTQVVTITYNYVVILISITAQG